LGHLCSRPGNLIPYFRYSITNCSPLELELPWWSLSAIRELEKHLNNNHRVFEWGSGGSSVFLARRCRELTTIEHEPDWFDLVEKTMTALEIQGSQLFLREINLENEKAFLTSPYASALQSSHDVIVIDGEDHFGPESSWSARESCFKLAEQWVCKDGGLIIVDDSWRYPALRQNTTAQKMVIHESIGPCRRGVTSTDFHYY
jgi:predicted O-methyltransferase YrrM